VARAPEEQLGETAKAATTGDDQFHSDDDLHAPILPTGDEAPREAKVAEREDVCPYPVPQAGADCECDRRNVWRKQ
jgi:hypothetical protein